jgi:hypothetical protein
MFESLIDVLVSGIAPAAGAAVIFFAAEVGAGGAQQFHDFAEAFAAFKAQIDARMVVQVFSVEHGGAIDFTDGGSGFVIGFHQMARDVRFLADAQQELRGAQTAAGAQICGMPAGRIGIHGGWRNRNGQSDQA